MTDLSYIHDIILQLLHVSKTEGRIDSDVQIKFLTPINNVSVDLDNLAQGDPENNIIVGRVTRKGEKFTLADSMTNIRSKEFYPYYRKLSREEFIERFNKTLLDYIIIKLNEAINMNVPDEDNIWIQPNAAFIEWFHNNGVEIETVKSFKDIPDVVPSEIEDSKDALWAIADDLRERKKSGEFQSYRDAYRWGENNMTQNNKPIRWQSLENAFDKAKAGGKV